MGKGKGKAVKEEERRHDGYVCVRGYVCTCVRRCVAFGVNGMKWVSLFKGPVWCLYGVDGAGYLLIQFITFVLPPTSVHCSGSCGVDGAGACGVAGAWGDTYHNRGRGGGGG